MQVDKRLSTHHSLQYMLRHHSLVVKELLTATSDFRTAEACWQWLKETGTWKPKPGITNTFQTSTSHIPGKDLRSGDKYDGQRIPIGNGNTSGLWGTWGNLIGYHPHVNLH